jgi:hypothetical protein
MKGKWINDTSLNESLMYRDWLQHDWPRQAIQQRMREPLVHHLPSFHDEPW